MFCLAHPPLLAILRDAAPERPLEDCLYLALAYADNTGQRNVKNQNKAVVKIEIVNFYIAAP